MDTGIKINTTQNVIIEYQAAGVGDRILGGLLDNLFVGTYSVLVLILTGWITKGFYNTETGTVVFLIIVFLPVIFYNLLCETTMQGQSLGKKIMKIKVVKLDGTQPQFGAYLLRWVLRLIDTGLFSGVIAIVTIALSDHSQRLGDMAAGTTVIKIKPKVSLKETILYKAKSNHQIVFQEVSKLSDKDISIIKEIYDHCTAKIDYAPLSKLAQKTKQKMEVSTTLPDVQFIKTVLLDYSTYEFEK